MNANTRDFSNINKKIETELNDIFIKKNKNILVLAGGGIKGITILGALKYLEDNNILNDIHTYIGASIGGIISVLLAAGYKSSDIYKFSELFDFNDSLNLNINHLLTNYSINDDENMTLIYDKLLKKKNIDSNISLINFYKHTKKKIICTSVCITTKKLEYISYENYPDLPLNIFIKMTSAAPLIMPPVKYNNKLYIDGGMMNNFPINIIDDDKINNTIGINLISTEYFKEKGINNILDYFISILHVVILQLTPKYDKEKYKNIAYDIDIEITNAFNFELTKEIKKDLFYKGYNFMKKNFIL
jgi:NTE family protein